VTRRHRDPTDRPRTCRDVQNSRISAKFGEAEFGEPFVDGHAGRVAEDPQEPAVSGGGGPPAGGTDRCEPVALPRFAAPYATRAAS
jgi:hypothetical protein